MELLAPAGSVEHYTTAIEAGADAVYVGAPLLNARNPSKEFSFEEIGAMVAQARDLDKRVYVALNSLVKEDDLPRLTKTLAQLEAIGPHGLIVQDLGVIELIARYFGSLRVHASTLLFAHSRNDVEVLADLGCSRVVLARELSLKEIESIVKSTDVEIEVFTHGAMCFSYSGRCLFSSYHGGKSGLRGNCVQPCRRKFSVGGRGAGSRTGKQSQKSGYVFSMNDLEGIDFIDQFKRIGLASIKIEGRLKPVTYVRNVVQAYRMVLDASGTEMEQARTEARLLLDGSLGRRRSTGYFLSSTPKDAIVSAHSGNIGTHLGTVTGFSEENDTIWAVLPPGKSCREGDRLRLHFERSGERTAFTVKQLEMRENGSAAVGIPGNIRKEKLQGKVELYRVDTGGEKKQQGDARLPKPELRTFPPAQSDAVRKKSRNVLSRIADTKTVIQPSTGKSKGDRRRGGSSELWVRIDSVKPIYQKQPFSIDRYIIPINKKTLSETGHLSRYFGKNRNRVIWALPPVAYDQRHSTLQRDVNVLMRSGFRSFQISTLGQLNLFHEKNISVYADYSLNVLNSRSMRFMDELGLKGFQFSIETDRPALKQAMSSYRQPIERTGSHRSDKKPATALVGLTVYGSPPLFMSRVHAQNVSFKQKITSPKKEDFVIGKVGAESFTRPVRPFSTLPFTKELETIGIDYMVIDLSGMHADRKTMQDLAKRVGGKERVAKLSAFNFDGHLE